MDTRNGVNEGEGNLDDKNIYEVCGYSGKDYNDNNNASEWKRIDHGKQENWPRSKRDANYGDYVDDVGDHEELNYSDDEGSGISQLDDHIKNRGTSKSDKYG